MEFIHLDELEENVKKYREKYDNGENKKLNAEILEDYREMIEILMDNFTMKTEGLKYAKKLSSMELKIEIDKELKMIDKNMDEVQIIYDMTHYQF